MLRFAGLVAAPFLVVAAAVSLVLGGRYLAANQYLEAGLGHAAFAQVEARLLRDLGRAALLLVPLAVVHGGLSLLSRKRWPVFAVSAVLGAALECLLAFLSTPGLTLTERRDIVLPSNLWSAFSALQLRGDYPLSWILVPGATLLLLLGVLLAARLPTPAFPPSRRTAAVSLFSCLALLVLGAAAVHQAARRSRERTQEDLPSVIFVTLDSLRADHLPAYGYPRPTTPHLDRFAASATVFENVTSQCNWTRPSYATMLTSRYTWEFGDEFLGFAEITMAELLKNAGHATYGFIQNPNLDPFFRFHQGFDYYYALIYDTSPWEVNEKVLAKMRTVDRPFFLFVHYWRPHYRYPLSNPFVPDFVTVDPAPLTEEEANQIMSHNHAFWSPDDPLLPEKTRYLRDLYDATLREVDEAFGELLEELGRSVDLEDCWIVFNSDHGDEFYEHGNFGHDSANLHEELVHVPLIVRPPRSFGTWPRRVASPVMNLDLLPTLAEALRLEGHRGFSGTSLLPLLREQAVEERPLLSRWRNLLAVRRGSLKLVVDLTEAAPPLLFDLSVDPGEQHPLEDPASHPDYPLLSSLAEGVRGLQGSGTEITANDPTLPEELRRQLEAVGYVGDGE